LAAQKHFRKWDYYNHKELIMNSVPLDLYRNKVLLSVSIPTYNRANVLEIALNRLLPQFEKHEDHIELVISDNASSDNTQEVIEKYCGLYPALRVKRNLQPYNTGFFGNFKKCRELASGKYFWLLSDNDHINPGVIDFLMDQLSLGNDVGAYYFNNNGPANKYSIERSDVDIFFLSEKAFMITLITSVVMLNDKNLDSLVMVKYPENSFLGFLFLCNALIINKKISIVSGKTYEVDQCKVSWDIFKVWTKDIIECIAYMNDNELLNIKTTKIFINGFLKHNTSIHVYLYLMNKNYNGFKYYEPEELKTLLDQYYSDYSIYKDKILPLFSRTRQSLYFEFICKRIWLKFLRLFKK
jgi:glycosyltransferase involved in cell wall biosynthesis